MVLQDVDAAQDSFSDNPSPSDIDTYSSNTASGGLHYDASDLPRPLPIVGPILGFSSNGTRGRVESTMKMAMTKIQRPLTTEESQALAYYLYSVEQKQSYGAAGASAIGIWRWYTTWEQGRFPFYKPKPENINPNKFLFIKGPAANYVRHSWRLFCYVAVAKEFGKILGIILGRNAGGDPILKRFNEELGDAYRRELPRTANGAARNSADERRAAWEEAARARNAERSVPGPPAPLPWNARKPTPADDDMSPTAGNDSWSSTSDSAWGNEVFPSDSYAESQPRQQSMSPPKPLSRNASRRDDNDDASPTGGMFQDEVQSQADSGGSAWDRLRRGIAPSPQGPPPSMSRRQPPHREQREGSTLGDSFSFVDSDSERSAEKERAQREFDARIEQERQGKDFNEERRW